jgi:hypothetical protein
LGGLSEREGKRKGGGMRGGGMWVRRFKGGMWEGEWVERV